MLPTQMTSTSTRGTKNMYELRYEAGEFGGGDDDDDDFVGGVCILHVD